ncbi:hypothetical protein AKJ62_01955 [candidate division MSBL1 archaeon SCGC-AAA259D14]|uniref:Uncharacterized protein n=1 Tax=candidate division MSBL1 archaeon SCGC-AAA259D14 TaxID=1698261 RepID=A0A133U728_9EURY|nr:hypothetical protein AKJ62_01955 [candidate division MSBL1 archaeon SCGC-AAA259D14]
MQTEKKILSAEIILVIAIILGIAHAGAAAKGVEPAGEILGGITIILMIISAGVGFWGYRGLK